VITTALLLAATFALMTLTASTGGRIRHPEAHHGLFLPRPTGP
jgi:hypothetical protein